MNAPIWGVKLNKHLYVVMQTNAGDYHVYEAQETSIYNDGFAQDVELQHKRICGKYTTTCCIKRTLLYGELS